MPVPEENVSKSVFDFLKSRFILSQSTDGSGQPTTEGAKMKVFSFEFKTKKGKTLGNVVVSLLDDEDSSNSVKIYFGKDIASAPSEELAEFQKFLGDLRLFAKSNMLGFSVKDINRGQLRAKDINPMFESQFGEIGGSVRTSVQPLDRLRLIIKHSDKIDPKIPGARSRKIEKIYLANTRGERFLMPFTSLKAARAMARHVSNGGTPYDEFGNTICHYVDELGELRSFFRKMRNVQVEDPRMQEILQSVKDRYTEIKKTLSHLNSQGGYIKHKASQSPGLANDIDDVAPPGLEPLDEISESISSALPYVWRAYNKRKLQETEDFSSWAGNFINKKL